MKFAFAFSAFLILGTATMASAEITTSNIDYKQNEITLEGFLAYDASGKDKRPAVIIFHDWNGIDSYEEARAKMLAELGYVGFAADIYGKGIRPANNDQSREQAMKYYADLNLFRARLTAAVDAVRKLPSVDSEKVAVIGYCFGGRAALEIARTGADIKAAVSFHGSLKTDNPAKKGAVRAAVCVFHASSDPSVSPDEAAAFHKEMLDAGLGYLWKAYPLSVHAFTVWGSPSYDETADKDSWETMKMFLQEVFSK